MIAQEQCWGSADDLTVNAVMMRTMFSIMDTGTLVA